MAEMIDAAAPVGAVDPVAGAVDPVAGNAPVVDPTAPAETPTTPEAAATPEEITYTDFIAPEGMTFNDEILGQFKGFAKDYKLSQEQAQAFIDLGVKQSQTIMAQVAQAQTAEQSAYLEAFNSGPDSVAAEQFTRPKLLEEQSQKWQAQLAADPEFGGAKFDENVGVAAKAMNAFATPELKRFFDKSGIGSHPEMVKAFFRIGQQLSEGKLVVGNGPGADTRRPADKFYGK